MRIRELTVQNYRPFKDRPPFQFSEQFSVIAGVNGRGKTAILDALALCLTRLVPQFVPRVNRHYRYLQTSDIYHEQGGSDLQRELSFDLKANCAGYPLNSFRVTYRGRDVDFPHLPQQVRAEIHARYEQANDGHPSSPIAVYYTTDRAGFRRPKTLPTRTPSTRIAAAYSGALHNRMVNYRDLMSRLHATLSYQDSERRINPAFFGDRVVETIQRALAIFLEGFRNLRIEFRPLRLSIDKLDGGKIITLELGQLSDGERSFLAMVCDLCRRLALANPQHHNILEGQGIVLIDELELHLHPTWQIDVAEKLRTTFPNIQFIVSTHSPFIVQSIRQTSELVALDENLILPPQIENRGVEEIAAKVMGIANPHVNPRYLEMLNVAREYFRLLGQARSANTNQLVALKTKLTELTGPYADNPAYQAFLEMNRVSAFRE